MFRSKVYKNIFTSEDLHSLINFYDSELTEKIYNPHEPGNEIQPLHYDKKYSPVYKIIRPKLNQFIGSDHMIHGGGYRKNYTPFGIHADNYNEISVVNPVHYKSNHDLAVLVPLVEDPRLKTILFDVRTELKIGFDNPLPESWLGEQNNLNIEDFDHIYEPTKTQIGKLSVDRVIDWKLGDMIIWDRNQLHASTNFAKFGLFKRFIVIWII